MFIFIFIARKIENKARRQLFIEKVPKMNLVVHAYWMGK